MSLGGGFLVCSFAVLVRGGGFLAGFYLVWFCFARLTCGEYVCWKKKVLFVFLFFVWFLFGGEEKIKGFYGGKRLGKRGGFLCVVS